jgi:pimeloyl-ACP methyl ester carboxylesterase
VPRAVVLVLHGGRAHSHESGERKRLSYWRMVPFARMLARHRELAVYLLRYRVRGWNAPDRDALRDARWAVADAGRRHPGAPIVLVGHSMGGRAALAAAGEDGVVAVCGLAPWLDGSDPVAQLADRSVLIVHGDRERFTDPRASYEYAVRAKRVTDHVARFDLPGAGHYMLIRAADWHGLVDRFVLGVTGLAADDRVIVNAMAEPAPNGLRVPLP